MAAKTQRADALQLHSFQVVSEGWNVRAFERDGQPWFVAADVCTALGIQNTTQALEPLDDDERSMFNIGRQGKANCINESGLYTLILRCREATTPGTLAHRFRKWVTADVLPSIRKNGSFQAKPLHERQRFLMVIEGGKITSVQPVANGACVIDPKNDVSVKTLIYEYVPFELINAVMSAAHKRVYDCYQFMQQEKASA